MPTLSETKRLNQHINSMLQHDDALDGGCNVDVDVHPLGDSHVIQRASSQRFRTRSYVISDKCESVARYLGFTDVLVGMAFMIENDRKHTGNFCIIHFFPADFPQWEDA